MRNELKDNAGSVKSEDGYLRFNSFQHGYFDGFGNSERDCCDFLIEEHEKAPVYFFALHGRYNWLSPNAISENSGRR